MSLRFTINATTVLSVESVRLRPDTNGFTSAAISGGSDTAAVLIEDPTGVLDLKVMQLFTVDEDECSPARIWTGIFDSVTVHRPESGRNSAARVWECELVGVNSFPGLRRFHTAGAKRPRESNLARIAWMMAISDPVIGFYDDGFVADANPQPFDEADYRGQTPADLLDDITGAINRNWFVFWNPATAHAALFYNTVDSGIGDSTLRISNIRSDASSVTYEPLNDVTLLRSGEEIYSAVYATGTKGSIWVRRTATEIAYIDRHAAIETDRISDPTKLLQWANAYLDAHATPRDLISADVYLPDNKVNLLREGQRVQVKFSHLPGYTSFAWTIVRRRTVSQSGLFDLSTGRPLYLVSLELSTSAVEGRIGGGSPGALPQPPCNVADHYYEGSISDTCPQFSDDSPTSASTTATWVHDTVYNWSLTVTVDNVTGTGFASLVIKDVGSGYIYVNQVTTGGALSGSFNTGGGNGLLGDLIATLQVIHNDTSVQNMTIDFYVDPAGWVPEVCPPPSPGQWVYGDIPTPAPGGGVRTFTTDWPFADGSLTVFVDNVDETAAVTSYNGATGSFTLAFDPRSFEVVTVQYQGR